MSLLKKYMQEAIDTMERDKMKLRFFGDLSALTPGAAGPGPPGERRGRPGGWLPGKPVHQLWRTG